MSLGGVVACLCHQKWPVQRVVLLATAGWDEDSGRATLWSLVRGLMSKVRSASEHSYGLDLPGTAKLLAKWCLPLYGPTYGLDWNKAAESLLSAKHVALIHGRYDEFHKPRFVEWSCGRHPDWYLKRG